MLHKWFLANTNTLVSYGDIQWVLIFEEMYCASDLTNCFCNIWWHLFGKIYCGICLILFVTFGDIQSYLLCTFLHFMSFADMFSVICGFLQVPNKSNFLKYVLCYQWFLTGTKKLDFLKHILVTFSDIRNIQWHISNIFISSFVQVLKRFNF